MRLLISILILASAWYAGAETRWLCPDSAGFDVRQDSGRNKPAAIYFYSNAPEICVEYHGKPELEMLCIDCCGKTDTLHAVSVDRKPLRYRFTGLTQAKFHKHGNEYRMFMPAGAAKIRIGVPDGSELVFIPRTPELQDTPDMVSGDRTTTIPVTQRREPDNYEWLDRHRAIVAEASSSKPRAVILGNSITHFWGGVPGSRHVNGAKSWAAVMEPEGFMNMGCGWDRIENVLWRVYHGELDGFEAEKIVLMIGTNNMGISSDVDIVEGIRFLIAAIRDRQPKAEIRVVGIMPRRGHEEWVRNINPHIAAMARESGCSFVDVGPDLVLPDGKVDETLFTDGLHPNDAGYDRIAEKICGKTGIFR